MGECPNPNGGLSVEKNGGTPGRGSPDVPQCERGCATGKLRPQGWGEPQAENGLSSYYAFPIAIIWRGKAKRGVGYAQPAERTCLLYTSDAADD